MNDAGQIVHSANSTKVESEPLTADDMRAMHENIKAQLLNKQRKNKDHVRLSLIWNCQQDIRKIQRELCQGYSFDYNALQALVNTMFGFINGIVDPDVSVKSADKVVIEPITE